VLMMNGCTGIETREVAALSAVGAVPWSVTTGGKDRAKRVTGVWGLAPRKEAEGLA
jgi:hypothetical protein